MSEREPLPDKALVEALAGKLFDLVVIHVKEWGDGNKPRLEAAMALGYAFGGLVEQHSDEDKQILTTIMLNSAKLWSDALKAGRKFRQAR